MQWLDDTFMWPGGTLFVCAKLATVSLNVYVHAGKAYRDIPEDGCHHTLLYYKR